MQTRICGHITTAMTERYSTVAQTEQREGVGKVVALMGGRPESQAKGTPASESGAPGWRDIEELALSINGYEVAGDDRCGELANVLSERYVSAGKAALGAQRKLAGR